MINIWKKIISLIGIIIVTFLVIHNTEIFKLLRNGELDSIIESLKENTFSKFFFTFMIMVIQNSFTVIPLIIIITINYTLFGFFNGLIWSWFTSIIAAGSGFMAADIFLTIGFIKKQTLNCYGKWSKAGFYLYFKPEFFLLSRQA